MTQPMPPLIGVADFGRPFATIGFALNRGVLDDPPGKEGLAHLTAQMLNRGTRRKTRPQIAEAIDHIGSSVDISVSRDHTTLWADGLTRHRGTLLDLLDELMTEPTFPEDELEKLKRETLADLAALRDDDASLGMRFFARKLYGAHPYARPSKGDERSLTHITRADLVALHSTWSASDMLVAIAGDLDADEQRAVAVRLGGALSGSGVSAPVIPAAEPTAAGWNVTIVDKPKRTQTQVFIGHIALDAMHADWTPLQVGQTSFGGTFTSRFSHEIREKRGWSYGAWSQLSGDPRLGTFMLRFYPNTGDTAPALALSHTLLSEFARTGPTSDEFIAAQSYLQNGFVFAIDTAVKRLSELVSARLMGYPEDHVDTTVERLRRVTYEDAVRTTTSHLRPDAMTVTIVGTASELIKDIEALPFVTSVDVVDWQAP
jgi:zinc protease